MEASQKFYFFQPRRGRSILQLTAQPITGFNSSTAAPV